MSPLTHNVGDLVVGIDTFTENNEVKCNIAAGIIIKKFTVKNISCISNCKIGYEVLWAKHTGVLEIECDCSLMSHEELLTLQKYSRVT